MSVWPLCEREGMTEENERERESVLVLGVGKQGSNRPETIYMNHS